MIVSHNEPSAENSSAAIDAAEAMKWDMRYALVCGPKQRTLSAARVDALPVRKACPWKGLRLTFCSVPCSGPLHGDVVQAALQLMS